MIGKMNETEVSKLPNWCAWERSGLKGSSIINLGNEWNDQAKFCNQKYKDWKKSLVEYFIKPYASKESCALEIACGHGRWTEILFKMYKKVFAVDISQNFLDVCKKRFKETNNVIYILKTKEDLEIEKTINFIWSYDSFVHFNPTTVFSYIKTFKKCMQKNAIGVIHHANKGKVCINEGARAYMTKELFSDMLNNAGLKPIKQVDEWGQSNQFNCKLFGDYITIFQQQE